MASSDAALPVDIIHLICDELAARNDYDSLYNSVVSSRYFASSGAVVSLYRICHECFTGGSRARDGPEDAALLGQILQKSTILWRSLILSAQDGKTLFPYCQFLRVLDLRDLGGLLDEPRFITTRILDYFFEGPMSKYSIKNKGPSGRNIYRLNIAEILLGVSNDILTKARLIEDISEPSNAALFARMLPQCMDRLSHLRHLDLMKGDIFDTEEVRADLHKHCPDIQELRIFSYTNDQADANLADFIRGLRVLERFENISQCGLGSETFTALGQHGLSLRHLTLMLDEDGFKALPNLTNCLALDTLKFEGTTLPASLKTLLGDEFITTISWLKQCKHLREVYFKHVPFAAEMITPVLEAHNDLMISLKIESHERSLFEVNDQLHLGFSPAISAQRRLEVLHLAANADDASEPRRLQFLQDICKVETLRHLELRRLCDQLNDDGSTIMALIFSSLPRLETLYYSGAVLGDACLAPLMTFGSNLKSMTFAGISDLSFTALHTLVSKLGPGNRGFALTIDFADPEKALSEKQQQTIRNKLAEGQGGSFSYTLIRDEQDLFSESDFSD